MKKILLFLNGMILLVNPVFITGLMSCSLKKGVVVNLYSENNKKNICHLVWKDEFDFTGILGSIKREYKTEENESCWGNIAGINKPAFPKIMEIYYVRACQENNQTKNS